jgi:acyl-CoA hydrolase
MKAGKPEDALCFLKPGMRVYLQGGPGECATFIDLLTANPGAARGVELWSCLIPGINTFDYGSLPDGPSLVTFMASPALEPSIRSGRTRIGAMPYSEIATLLSRTDFDLAILHASQPDQAGHCSFGIACEAPGIVWPRAKRRVAFVNDRMPRIPGSDGIPADQLDLIVPVDAQLLSPCAPDKGPATLARIAHTAAELIADNSIIQSGIGEAPAAIVAELGSRRGLCIHSGIVTPEYRFLADRGALDRTARHIAGIAWGGADFYAWLATAGIAFRSAFETHDYKALGRRPRFTSIGSALEVDLEGNINLEWAGGRRVSSVGGAPDYMRAAAESAEGRSIIALPSTTRAGASRIIGRFERPSIPASLADIVVTEHGVASLKGLRPEDRAEALIAIAAPEHRDGLASSGAGRQP